MGENPYLSEELLPFRGRRDDMNGETADGCAPAVRKEGRGAKDCQTFTRRGEIRTGSHPLRGDPLG
jgi:hypothetical protein